MNTRKKEYRKAKALKNDDFIEYSEEEAEYLGLDLKKENDDSDEDRLDDDEIVSKEISLELLNIIGVSFSLTL